jgi:hypothetical protein
MNDFESERAAKAARFRQLAEKHANIATGQHFAARERLENIPLGQPILVALPRAQWGGSSCSGRNAEARNQRLSRKRRLSARDARTVADQAGKAQHTG